MRPEPLIQTFSFGAIIVPALILLFFTGLLEEIIFRGLLQGTSRFVVGKYSIWYVSALFAVMHLGYKSVLDIAFVFAVAMLFGYIAARTGTIRYPAPSHRLLCVYIPQLPNRKRAASLW